jgi:two-component system response regulator HydG
MRKRGGKKAKPVKLPSLPGEERLQIIATLEEAGWNQSESARRLGITRNTLRYRMKKYNIKTRPRQTSHA